MLPVSVIIATMNRVDALAETLSAIETSSVLPAEVLLVDQSTESEKVEALLTLIKNSSLTIRYHHLPKPSLTAARNFGLEQAQNDTVVFMDDDVSVQKDTFSNIIRLMADDSLALIAGLNLQDKKSNNRMGYFFGLKSRKKEKAGGYVTAAMFGRFPREVVAQMPTEWAMGYFFVVRKALVQKWDLFWDERLIKYGYPEDLDFSYQYAKRAALEQKKCIICPEVAVYHRVSQEWRETSRTVTFMKVINREYLSYKFQLPFYTRLATRWANFGVFLSRCIQWDRPLDVLKAQYYCDRYRKDIRNGNLHTELYARGAKH